MGKEQVYTINGASFTAVFELYSVNFDPILVFQKFLQFQSKS